MAWYRVPYDVVADDVEVFPDYLTKTARLYAPRHQTTWPRGHPQISPAGPIASPPAAPRRSDHNPDTIKPSARRQICAPSHREQYAVLAAVVIAQELPEAIARFRQTIDP